MYQIAKHPDYPSLVIVVATTASDKPQPGAFFVTHQTVVLSDIAVRAYPATGETVLKRVNRINRSRYNMEKCIYRWQSGNCHSAKVPGQNALTTAGYGDGGWLSLCNIDKGGMDGLGAALGTKYQVIWIPPISGEEPWDLDPGVEEKPPEVPKTPDIDVVVPPGKHGIPGINFDIDVNIGKGNGSVEVDPEPEPEPEPEPQKAGVGWIPAVVLGAGALITVLVFALKKKKKKGDQ